MRKLPLIIIAAALLVSAPRLAVTFVIADGVMLTPAVAVAVFAGTGIASGLVLTGGNVYIAHALAEHWRRRNGLWTALLTAWLLFLVFAVWLIAPLLVYGLEVPAREAVSMFSAPGLNVMYGDTDGNIAWWAAAKLPVRPAHVASKLFLRGDSGIDEYDGYYDFSKNPQAINPPSGFVYSANNQPEAVDGVLYPGYYYPRSRAGRIVELLSADKKFSRDDLSRLQLDVVSSMHRDIARELVAILTSIKNEALTVLINELTSWDGVHHAELIAPAVYNTLLDQIMHMAMEDEIGVKALSSLLKTSIPKNSYQAFITNASNPWWDDVTTIEKSESREEIIEKAALKTIALLKQTCGEKPESWKWGKIHTLTHAHALGAVKPLDKFFNVGPFTVDGGSEVINNLHYKLENTGYFHVDGGPALRKVTDFGDIENGITVCPTGQSGNVMSPHYNDQAEMFATGKTRKMMMNKEEIKQQSPNTLKLIPGSN